MRNRFPTLALILAFVLVAPLAAQSDEAHAQKLADIRKLMTLTGGDKIADQMFDQMAASMKAMAGPNGTSAEGFFQEFRKELDFNKIIEIVSASYDKYLSADDVKALIQFYESTSGKHMIEAMPKITTDMMTQMMPLSQEIARKVMTRAKEQQKDK